MPTPTALPASFSPGDVLTAANMNLLRGGFRILQVVFGDTATPVSNSTNVLADTGLTATITPQSNTNKILVLVSQNGLEKSAGNSLSRIDIKLFRGVTEIAQIAGSVLFTNSLLNIVGGSVSTMFLDSPATTSATTYKTQFLNNANAASVTVQSGGGNRSTITLLEVSA